MALLLIKSSWPKALLMVQEGVAAYYGGYMDLSYSDIKASLRRYLASKKDLDLSMMTISMTFRFRSLERTV